MYFCTVGDAARPKVAALIAWSGDASHIGRVVFASFRKSVKDLRRSCRRSRGCKIPKITYLNTRSSPAKALRLFRSMYRRGVRVFIGLVTSAEAEVVAKYASKRARDAVLVSPTSTATKLCKYRQLYCLTMDERGYAEVLFDLAIDAKTKNMKEILIQVAVCNVAHRKGLVNDINRRFKDEDVFKVLPPISYKVSGLTRSLGQLVSQVNSSLAKWE